jgi:alpha-L-fucosidase
MSILGVDIRNNPTLQEVTFAPVAARFFRFTALQDVNAKNWTSAAEISVVPVSSPPGTPDTRP